VISSNALAQKLKASPLPALWAVTGDEPLLALEAEDAIRCAAAKAGYTERKTFSMDGMSDWAPVMEALSGLSLFGERQLIEIRLLTGNPGAKAGPKTLEALPAFCGENNFVMVLLPALDWAQKKKKWFTDLSLHAQVVEANAFPREQLPHWIGQRLRAQGQEPDEEVLRYIAYQTEGNLLAASQEIRKLSLLLPQGSLHLSDIQNAVSDVSRFDPKDLILGILDGDSERIARTIAGLRAENTLIPTFMWQIYEDLRVALRLKQCMEARLPQPFERLYKYAEPAKQKAFNRLLQRTNSRRIEAALARLSEVDKISKGLKIAGRDDDPWIELQAAALMLAR
jgi:DNA polymerase-3 subunit delta